MEASRDNYFLMVSTFVVKNTIEQETGKRITDDTRISELGLDSLEVLELLHLLGVSNDKVSDLETVGDICDCLSR